MHITRSAPAKINLSLLVGPVGPSGYHEIFTVFVPVDVYDVLSFAVEAKPAAKGQGELHVRAHSVEPEANIVAHALRALERETGWALTGRVSIDKGIPVAAGMGGGSTDAATALLVGSQLIREAGGPALDDAQLHRIARGLGADVPFFLDARPAIGRGIGEILEPLSLPEVPLLLIFTDQPLSTAHVYREFDLRHPAGGVGDFARRAAEAEEQWRRVGTVEDVVRLLQNDLQETSCNLLPGLCEAGETLLQEGALGASMSGSGPTIYGICASLEHAEELCSKVSADGMNCRVALAHAHPLNSDRVGTHGLLQPRID